MGAALGGRGAALKALLPAVFTGGPVFDTHRRTHCLPCEPNALARAGASACRRSPSVPLQLPCPRLQCAGKTLLARAVANRTDACFIRVIGSELVQKYVGEGARMVSRALLPPAGVAARPVGRSSAHGEHVDLPPLSLCCHAAAVRLPVGCRAWRVRSVALLLNASILPGLLSHCRSAVECKYYAWAAIALSRAAIFGRPPCRPPSPALAGLQVRELFQMARSKKACIIFFDEVRPRASTRLLPLTTVQAALRMTHGCALPPPAPPLPPPSPVQLPMRPAAPLPRSPVPCRPLLSPPCALCQSIRCPLSPVSPPGGCHRRRAARRRERRQRGAAHDA